MEKWTKKLHRVKKLIAILLCRMYGVISVQQEMSEAPL